MTHAQLAFVNLHQNSSYPSEIKTDVCLLNCFSGPGEIRVSFEYNRSRQSLLIYVGEIKDVKLPAGTETLFSLTMLYHKLSKEYGNL